MHFEVETNTARPNAAPIWRPILQRDGPVATWADAGQAHDETAAEGREGFRVVQVEGDARAVVTLPAKPGGLATSALSPFPTTRSQRLRDAWSWR